MKCLTSITTSLSLLVLVVPHPALASISCKSGTISAFGNGSVQSCVLEQTMNMNTGVFSFECQHGQSISFDVRARLVGCTLDSSFSIRQKDGSILNCQPGSPVNISYQDDGTQYAGCH